jgi:hypothetical protein
MPFERQYNDKEITGLKRKRVDLVEKRARTEHRTQQPW